MATSGHEQRRRRDAQSLEAGDRSAAEQAPVDLERLEAGQDLSPELMAVLAPQLGNLGLQDAFDRQGRGASGVSGQEEDEQLALEADQEEDILEELEASEIVFGGGGGGGGGGGDPWDVGQLFGGDDDDEVPNKPRPRAAPPRPREDGEEEDDDDFFEDDEPESDPDALDPAVLDPVERRLGPVADPDTRVGDARYVAVEPALTSALYVARRALRPEALADIDHPADPIGRPAEVGAFLWRHGRSPRSRALGRLVARGTAALCPPAGGHAGAAARLATLAVCAEVSEGGLSVDRAVQLALLDEAWPAAVEAARPLSRRGRLRSPLIVAAALGAPLDHDGDGRIPTPSPLGGAALREALPPPLLTEVPRLDPASLTAPTPDPADPLTELDAVLHELTGGAPPKVHPTLERATVAPLLTAARHLMNAVGRGYVEVAAAALAVRFVHAGAPVAATVRVADRTLTTLAREVLKAGKTLERAVGYRLEALDLEELQEAATALRRALATQQALMDWTVDTLAGALDA